MVKEANLVLLGLNASPVDYAMYGVGDIIIEDRSHYIGTEAEDPYDSIHPIVELEVLSVHLDQGVYWMWNRTRSKHTIGYINSMNDSSFKRVEK